VENEREGNKDHAIMADIWSEPSSSRACPGLEWTGLQ